MDPETKVVVRWDNVSAARAIREFTAEQECPERFQKARKASQSCGQSSQDRDDAAEADLDLRDSLQTLIESHGWERTHEALQGMKDQRQEP